MRYLAVVTFLAGLVVGYGAGMPSRALEEYAKRTDGRLNALAMVLNSHTERLEESIAWLPWQIRCGE